MPIHARRTRPSRISAEITARVVALIGIASPRPTPATAVLIPTTRPRPSTSAPPELPGLSAASVWMTSSTIRVVSPGAGRQRAAERGDDAGGHRAGEPVRVADRDHELADAQRGGVAELGGRVRLAVGAQHREVGKRVGADHARLDLAPVGERGPDARAAAPALDHVGGGEHEAVGRDHTPEPPPRARHPQVGDRRRELLGDVRDDPRVGVERLGVGGQRTWCSGLVGKGHLQNASDCGGVGRKSTAALRRWVPVGVAGGTSSALSRRGIASRSPKLASSASFCTLGPRKPLQVAETRGLATLARDPPLQCRSWTRRDATRIRSPSSTDRATPTAAPRLRHRASPPSRTRP